MRTPPVNTKATWEVERALPVSGHGVGLQMSQASCPRFTLSHLNLPLSLFLCLSRRIRQEDDPCISFLVHLPGKEPQQCNFTSSLDLKPSPVYPPNSNRCFTHLSKENAFCQRFYVHFCPLGVILIQIVTLHHSNYLDKYL